MSTTDATIETKIIVRQPSPPPSGLTSTFRPTRIASTALPLVLHFVLRKWIERHVVGPFRALSSSPTAGLATEARDGEKAECAVNVCTRIAVVRYPHLSRAERS